MKQNANETVPKYENLSDLQSKEYRTTKIYPVCCELTKKMYLKEILSKVKENGNKEIQKKIFWYESKMRFGRIL